MDEDEVKQYIATQPRKMQEARFRLEGKEVGICRICVMTTSPRYIDWAQSQGPDFTNDHQDIVYHIGFTEEIVRDALERGDSTIQYSSEGENKVLMEIEYGDV